MKKITNKNWANECRTSILLGFPSIGQEYIDEAEHQDGKAFWANFETVSEVLKDVKEYQKAADDDCASFSMLRDNLHKELDILVNGMRSHESPKNVGNVTLRVISEIVHGLPEQEKLYKFTYEVELLELCKGDWMSETRVAITEEYDLTPNTMPDSKPDQKTVFEITDGGGIQEFK